MFRIALFCKSYSKDLHRVCRLARSFGAYNADSIPLYISVPEADLAVFERELPAVKNLSLMTDESIYDSAEFKELRGWERQQVTKLAFSEKKLCYNYAIIDSESFFIRDFYIADFLYDDETPYQVISGMTMYWEKLQRHGMKVRSNYEEVSAKIQEFMGRKGSLLYGFGPSPIFSSLVVDYLNNYLQSRGMSFVEAIRMAPYEFNWYGESLIVSRGIKYLPRDSIIKCYNWEGDYAEDCKNIDILRRDYLALHIQCYNERSLDYNEAAGNISRIAIGCFVDAGSEITSESLRFLLNQSFPRIDLWLLSFGPLDERQMSALAQVEKKFGLKLRVHRLHKSKSFLGQLKAWFVSTDSKYVMFADLLANLNFNYVAECYGLICNGKGVKCCRGNKAYLNDRGYCSVPKSESDLELLSGMFFEQNEFVELVDGENATLQEFKNIGIAENTTQLRYRERSRLSRLFHKKHVHY